MKTKKRNISKNQTRTGNAGKKLKIGKATKNRKNNITVKTLKFKEAN